MEVAISANWNQYRIFRISPQLMHETIPFDICSKHVYSTETDTTLMHCIAKHKHMHKLYIKHNVATMCVCAYKHIIHDKQLQRLYESHQNEIDYNYIARYFVSQHNSACLFPRLNSCTHLTASSFFVFGCVMECGYQVMILYDQPQKCRKY